MQHVLELIPWFSLAETASRHAGHASISAIARSPSVAFVCGILYLGLDFKLCSGSRIFPVNRLGIIFQTFANWNEFHCCMFSLDSRLFTLVHFHHFLGSYLLVHALFYYPAGSQKYLMTHVRFPGD